MAEGDDDKDSKTEDPTQKKLDEAAKRGDVAKSQEISTWFMLFAVTMVVSVGSAPTMASFYGPLKAFLSNMEVIRTDAAGLMSLYQSVVLLLLIALGLPLLIFMLGGIAGNMIQHRLVWSGESLKPKLSKLSPMAGMKRVFGKEAWVSFGKGIIKLAIISSVMFFILSPQWQVIDTLVRTDIAMLLPYTRDIMVKVLIAVLSIMFFVAIGDFVFQYYTWYNRQRMSLQEMKEEFKQAEGNQEIKAKLRQIRRERARNRMMSNVPKATVVITNPTHYAVALQYDDTMAAPICVAKGMDNIALKIREVAGNHEIPIMENPPLARALHATVEVDEMIPEEHFRAVAEVIGFVLRLKQGGRR